jgi:hypothetical protein
MQGEICGKKILNLQIYLSADTADDAEKAENYVGF